MFYDDNDIYLNNNGLTWKDKTVKHQKIFNKRALISFLFLIIIILFLIYSYFNTLKETDFLLEPNSNKKTDINHVKLYHYEDEECKSETVNLPLKVNPEFTYFFDFNIPSSNHPSYLSVNLHYIDFNLRCGDELIYTNSTYKNEYIKSISEAFNLIPIPDKYLNKTLTIEFRSTLNGFRKLNIPVISYGSKYSLYSHFFDEGYHSIVWGMFFIISSIFIMISPIFMIKATRINGNIFTMGIFTFSIGIYICLRSWIPYYYIPNNALIHFIDYTTIIIMPLPFYLLFINHFNLKSYFSWRTTVFEIGAILTLFNLIFEYFLVFSKISEFIYFQHFTFAWIPISALFIFIILLTCDKKELKNKNYLILSITPMIFISSVTVLFYLRTYNISTSVAIIFSIIFFIFVNFIIFMKNDMKNYNKILENEFYEKLAYTDSLTQLKNRNSFEKEKEKIIKKEVEFKKLVLFMIDMNFLKEINDNFGHSDGDLYLKEIGNILLLIEQTFPRTISFRYGGDEFVIISYNPKDNIAHQIENTITELCEKFDSKNKYPLSLAVGFKFEEYSDGFNIDELLKEVDIKMYKNKEIKKGKIKEVVNYEKTR